MQARDSPQRHRGVLGIVVTLGALIGVIGVAAPAYAAVVENGTAACSGKYSYVDARTKGATRAILTPGKPVASTEYTYGMSTTTWATATRQGNNGGGYWEVYSTANIDNAYTDGYCSSFG